MLDFFDIPFKMDFIINEGLLAIAAFVTVVACVRLMITKSLVESILLMSVFSLFIGVSYLFMDAPDVAMTETALGAGLSTCVLLNVIKIVGDDIGNYSRVKNLLAAGLCLIFIVCLSWASLDLPDFGSIDSPLQSHMTKYYVDNTQKEVAIPSMVAAILASYRGFDTLGESAVILIAGIGVLAITSRRKKQDA